MARKRPSREKRDLHSDVLHVLLACLDADDPARFRRELIGADDRLAAAWRETNRPHLMYGILRRLRLPSATGPVHCGAFERFGACSKCCDEVRRLCPTMSVATVEQYAKRGSSP